MPSALPAGAATDRSSAAVILVVSDIHYAGAAERARSDYELRGITHPLTRAAVRFYRHYVWKRDPFAHNHLVDAFLAAAGGADRVVANGDYSCDSAFVGVSDPAAAASAAECLDRLRAGCGDRLRLVLGDHELGKKSLVGGQGGLRYASWEIARERLGLPAFWQETLGGYVLMGVTSTLLALPVFEAEAQPEELDRWRARRADHLDAIRRAFAGLAPGQRVILFCHDPTALPFLAREPAVRDRLGQVELTVIGHLHSALILWLSRRLAGMPAVSGLGNTVRRLSTALREARHWRPFHVRLGPALSGLELLRDGGYGRLVIDLDGRRPARYEVVRLPAAPPACRGPWRGRR
jgi:hypothetical protein